MTVEEQELLFFVCLFVCLDHPYPFQGRHVPGSTDWKIEIPFAPEKQCFT